MSEVRLATYGEIEIDIWILSPERTKNGRKHRVPLVDEALRVIELAKVNLNQNVLFPSSTGKPLSDAAMAAFMKREGYAARPQAFRATFRTWVEEQTETEYEVKEAATGHKVDTGITGAHQRFDRLQKRRAPMFTWNQFLTS